MKAIFLSDAHLKGPADPVQGKILRLFDRLRGKDQASVRPVPADALPVDRLVIAGDFFDFWFERGGEIYPGFRPLIDRIAVLKQQGVRITLCEGNHDFFLGDYFQGRLGIAVYPEWAEMEMDGLRIFVSHGDTVDMANRKYLALRKFLRSPFVYRLQRLLPLKLLWRMARLCSEMSKERFNGSQGRLEETMHRFARGKFQEGYDAVILGHCHKPLLRKEAIGGRPKTFVILGDWITYDSYLSYDDGLFTLNHFPSGG